jgi:hypothetical protein
MKTQALVSLTSTICLLTNLAILPLFIFTVEVDAIEGNLQVKQNSNREAITGYEALDVINQSLEEIFQVSQRYPECGFRTPPNSPSLDFNLSAPLTRASTATLLSRAFLGSVEEFATGARSNSSLGDPGYTDVRPTDYYYRDLSYIAERWRSIMPISSGTFRAYREVTSTEFYGFFTNAFRQANVFINDRVGTCRSKQQVNFRQEITANSNTYIINTNGNSIICEVPEGTKLVLTEAPVANRNSINQRIISPTAIPGCLFSEKVAIITAHWSGL